VEKRWGNTVLNCKGRLGNCSALQWWPTTKQSGCLGLGFAVQYTAKKPTPLRLLCSRLRLRPPYAPASATAFAFGQKSTLAPVPPGAPATGRLRAPIGSDRVGATSTVRGATTSLKLTFHLDHSVGADQKCW
jgi:hypothetical protein